MSAAKKKKKVKRNRGRAGRRVPKWEWVGARLQSPFYVTEGGPYRPEMLVWLELPTEIIVSMTLLDPEGPPKSLTQALREAIAAPADGPPRRPPRVRVADPSEAAAIARAFSDLEVVTAPTPELDAMLKELAEFEPPAEGTERPSYLEAGRVAPEVAASLFRSAARLFPVAPWEVTGDHRFLRLDIPRLGIEGACVSITGATGQSTGFAIFPSMIAFRNFVRALEIENAGGPKEIGTDAVLLRYERGADLPPAMMREATAGEWPVAAPDAYPVIYHPDRDGMLRPLTEHDYRVIGACAHGLSEFCVKHRQRLGDEALDATEAPVSESYVDEDDLEVHLTLPYRTGPLDAAQAEPPVSRDAAARGVEPQATQAPGRPAQVHELDERLINQLVATGMARFGDSWTGQSERPFRDPEAALQLFVPWSLYHARIKRKPLVQWFLEEQGGDLTGEERGWLLAQQAAWLSIWEVLQSIPGRSIALRDLLTGEERVIWEAEASKLLKPRDTLLGRVVDHDGVSVLCGVHPRPLCFPEAEAVIERIRRHLRRKRALIPVERLRAESIGRHLIEQWEDVVAEFDRRQPQRPQLQNMDGDDLLLTIDHFEFDPRDRREIQERVASLDEATDSAGERGETVYAFVQPATKAHRSMEEVMVGRAVFASGKLRLETNSVRRADALRQRIEDAAGALLRHRAREHADPLAAWKAQGDMPSAETQSSPLPAEEMARLLREAKARHYANWPDVPVPALGGISPREAIRTRRGRRQVEELLASYEAFEARLPADEQFDFSILRRELGLD